MSAFSKVAMMLAQLLILSVSLSRATSYTPHIIIITADDIGYNDVGFHHGGEGDAKTPFLDKYAKVSMVLENYYVMPNGHSTRSALMTAKHPAILGTQFEVKDATIPYGLDPGETILPQYLKELGYQCHAVGQWDLGFYSQDLLPTKRGYDSFYGSYLPYGDYITHKAKDQKGHEGLDLHSNTKLDPSEVNTFKPELYGRKAEQIIENHDDSKAPLHLYLALQGGEIADVNSLCKDSGARRKIPNEYYANLPRVKDPTRKCYLALVSAMDQVFGRIMAALKSKMMLSNSVVVFTTTSGGPAAGRHHFNTASNWPFRGAKLTGWEGGIRGVGLVYTDRIKSGPKTSKCLFHVTDWIPTLLSLYGDAKGSKAAVTLKPRPSSALYGLDQYNCIFTGASSVRFGITHFVYGKTASLMKHNFKYVVNTDKHLSEMNERYYSYSVGKARTIGCGSPGIGCNPSQRACLFNIQEDPCEMRNIAAFPEYQPNIDSFMAEIAAFNKTVRYSTPGQPDERGSPANNKASWQPWLSSATAPTAHLPHTLLLSLTSLVVLVLNSVGAS